jgi:ribosomal protein S18 acetylase RimI-like enzyme
VDDATSCHVCFRMQITALGPDRVAEAASLVAACQQDPDSHISYLSATGSAIEEELVGLEPDGLDGVVVAIDGHDRIVGLLGVEHDEDPPRAWWYGPCVAPGQDHVVVADALLKRARDRLPPHVTQQECAFDADSTTLASFAQRNGFVSEEGSVILSVALPLAGQDPEVADVEVGAPDSAAAAQAAGLHDRLFPGTHSTGQHALREDPGRVVLVAHRAGRLAGYVVAERQADGYGYLDFVGVAPDHQNQGIGRVLVAAAFRELAERLGCPRADLSVRESNVAARRLYAALGFAEERVILPWRQGFSLGPSAG